MNDKLNQTDVTPVPDDPKKKDEPIDTCCTVPPGGGGDPGPGGPGI